ncbi:Kv channel-interacting protein 4-like isoform X2 [Scaptodrosophila lebanonensis]|uniref:Kv channel-interacting protein 4-like isoform X2 n=1 Tax=Drosophila lebanonensis TaxID=7225 RepID=A0A6J2TSP5_DROLE|nr:Kv channel-interacting protein 4-like isoform X2 [Scaptodrosophila lebanonensis]
MAGPQVQHTQRPHSAYYTGLNGSGGGSGGGGGGGGGGGAAAAGMPSSASHTGLHALRQVSNETELIYRGSHSNGTVNEIHPTGSRGIGIIQQQPHTSREARAHALAHSGNIVSIAGPGPSATDALIGTIATNSGTSSALATSSGAVSGGLRKSNTQRSIEIIVDATQCGKMSSSGGGGGGGADTDADDVEQGGGQETMRKSSRHRHRPLHRRLISYLRSLFQGSTAQNDSELEEFETPARYRPDSLSALSRATRFTEDEIKRIYRGFKAECPTGVVKEDTFKVIYSQFFPQGGSCANPTLYAHYVFNTLDQDHSGIVSFEDFVQGLSILSRGSVEEKLRWTFSLYDINGDGFITREEMTDIVTAIYELMGRLPDECPEEEKIKGKVEQIFQKMDINRDGVVTLEEFLEACRNDEAISRSMSVFDTAF